MLIVAALAIGVVVAPAPTALVTQAQVAEGPYVEVHDLSVNGLGEADRLGIGDTSPILAWRMSATEAAASHPCNESGPGVACPADAQTAYQIEAAHSIADLESGNLIWDSGRVTSSAQSGVPYNGAALQSRDVVVWRVRVWDADGIPSNWSAPSQWEMGLLEQSDWGDARWIDYPGRTEDDPLPIFARPFDVGGDVEHARLYLSGIGVHHATVNGQELTDEVLAPGYSNWQLASEYRTYDVTDALVDGSNTLGVQLGNGTGYVRRSITNPDVGRTSPYAWWQSQLKGSGTLLEDAAAGASNVLPSSTDGYHLGGTINIDTGDGGERLESRVITNIGTAPTTVAAPNVIGGTPTPSLTGANWIWNLPNANSATDDGTIHLRKTFEVADPSTVASAVLRVNADDGHATYLNGTLVSESGNANNSWQTSQIDDISSLLVAGTNVIAAAPFNGAGSPGSYIAVAEIDGERIITDDSWRALPGTTDTPPAGWNEIAFDDSAWQPANISAPYGSPPWNSNVQEPPGPTNLRVASTQGFSVGDTIAIDTDANEEIREIAGVGGGGANGSGLTLTEPLTIVHETGAPVTNLTNPNTGISFEPPLDGDHAAGALVTGSGNNIAASDPTAGAAVTPRLIGWLEITYGDGSTEVIVSDRSWRTAFGPHVTDAWYAGSDYDARREQPGWDAPGADLSETAVRRDGSPTGWVDAGIAPPPNLATQLVARDAPPVRIVEEFVPVGVSEPVPGTYVFDFGQNVSSSVVAALSLDRRVGPAALRNGSCPSHG